MVNLCCDCFVDVTLVAWCDEHIGIDAQLLPGRFYLSIIDRCVSRPFCQVGVDLFAFILDGRTITSDSSGDCALLQRPSVQK